MTMLLDDVRGLLIAANVVDGVTGWSLFLSYLPPTPDQVVAVTETGGPAVDQTDGPRFDTFTFQVQVRGVKYGYAAARVKADEVFTALNDSNLTGYAYMFSENGPTTIGYDDNYRPRIALNFKTLKLR